ncbi:MAG: chalcone isomerase family protein [Pseudomonadota bacterium]
MLAALWVPTVVAQANGPAPSEVRTDLPGARLQGQGRLRFFGLHVYDIRLWTLAPLRADDALRTNAALEIEYARPLKGALIAERSLTEMKRVAEISAADGERWLTGMKALFPDVQPGDRITGVHRPGEGVRFHVNGGLIGELRDASFARLFFGIWLSPRTSEPQLRNALLGSAP